MPEYDTVRMDEDMDLLLKDYTEDEVVDYMKANKGDYVIDDSSVPKNGKGGGGLFSPKKIEALRKIPGKIGMGSDMPLGERAGKTITSGFADSWVGSGLAWLEDPSLEVEQERYDRLQAYNEDASLSSSEVPKRPKGLLELKEVYEKELAENPPEGFVEHAVTTSAYIGSKVPDFLVLGEILAPLKSLEALSFLAKYPRFAHFFAQSQHTGAIFAGIEAKHGPEAAIKGYLAGLVFTAAQLPKSVAVKAVTLGLIGKWGSMLQGASTDESNANAVILAMMPVIHSVAGGGTGEGVVTGARKAYAGRTRHPKGVTRLGEGEVVGGRASKQARLTPNEYSRAKADALRIARKAGIPRERALAVYGEMEHVARGNITKGMANYLLETHTDSKFRRDMNVFHQELSVGGPEQELQNFADFVDRINKVEEPFVPERIIPGEEYSPSKEPRFLGESSGELRSTKQIAGYKGLRSTQQITGEALTQPEHELRPEEIEARVKETFNRPEHPASIKRPEKPKPMTIKGGILAGMEARKFDTRRAKTSMDKFNDHLDKGEVRAAQIELSEVKDHLTRHPQDTEMLTVETEMIERFKQEDAGTVVKDKGNKFLRDQNKTKFLKKRRHIGALQTKLGWDRAQYQKHLKDTFGVESASLLTGDQIDKLVKGMMDMTGESKGKGSTVRPESGKVKKQTIITAEQEQSINKRMAKLREDGMTGPDLVHVYDKAGLKPDHKIGFQDTENFTTEHEAKALSRELHLYEETIAPIRAMELATRNSQNPELQQEYAKRIAIIEGRRGGKTPSGARASRYYMMRLSQISGGELPFFEQFLEIIGRRNTILYDHRQLYKRLWDANGEKGKRHVNRILNNPEREQRITDYIASRSKHKNKPKEPKDMTIEEIRIAQEMMKIFDEYKWKSRAWQFYDWKYRGIEPADYKRKGVAEQLDVADRVYEEGGQPALFDLLKNQTWGVLKDGFEAHDRVLYKKLNWSKETFGRGTASTKRAIEYQKQERGLFKRFDSYLMRMDRGTYLTPHIEALYDTYLRGSKGELTPREVEENIEVFLREIQGVNFEKGPLARAAKQAYGQIMLAVILSKPVLSYRNLHQNLVMHPNRRSLVDPRNRKARPDELEHIDQQVYSSRSIMSMLAIDNALFDRLPVLREVNKIARGISTYGFSDDANRLWGWWAQKNHIERGFMIEGTLEQKLLGMGFSDLDVSQQKHALEVLATQGEDAFGTYFSDEITKDVHVAYSRAERSFWEMFTGVGQFLTNIFAFSRSYTERLLRSMQKVRTGIKGGRVTPEGRRALNQILSLFAATWPVNEIYTYVTGREGPYSPLNIIAYSMGGLQLGALNAGTTFSTSLFRAITAGDEETRDRAISTAIIAAPKIPEMTVPYYTMVMDGLESISGTEFVDRKALRQIRQAFDANYTLPRNAHKLERSWFQKFQHLFAGGGVDYRIKKKAKEDRDKVRERLVR